MQPNSSHKKSTVTIASLLIALGIIYGDIGTSPLYTFKAIIGDKKITELLVYGGVSCIFWTLLFQTTVKYVWITLKADNDGEGGIFSLYNLVRRYGKQIIIPTIIGASALLADGIITPAVSVTSAIEGLTKIPEFRHIEIIPIVIFIISIIFVLQRFGSEKVGKAFGPIMFLWFSTLCALGIAQILKYPEIVKALNPKYAYDLLIHYPNGFWILGAVFLCTTGAEALYSDLGHCGRKNIRITWIFVKICLVINYLGQSAWLMHQDALYLKGLNPFFEIMPKWFMLPGIILSTLAAIVASQALITGSFTLINEAINLNCWQKVIVKQPSESKGQIYIPSINLILWLGCTFMVIYFQESSKMEAAYGLAITMTMLTTTYLLYFFLRYKLKWNLIGITILLSIFFAIETSFFIANVVKFKEGGYITIIAAAVFFLIMYTSYFGRKINNKYINFVNLRSHIPLIKSLSIDKTIPKYTTHLIYLSKADKIFEIEEKIIESILAKKPKRADVYWILHINRTNHPYTLDYDVYELEDDKIIKIVLNIGFRIQPRTEVYFLKIINELIANKELNLHLKNNGSTKYNTGIDFRFVVQERYISVENEFAFKDGFILKAFFFLKQFAIKDVEAFGLDKSDVLIEEIPVVYQPAKNINLVRRNKTI